jgi:hypothetical protein
MKIKTSELQEEALDWAVAKCEFNEPHYEPDDWLVYVTERDSDDDGWIFKPSTDWSQGGPIIERERISTQTTEDYWYADLTTESGAFIQLVGDTALVAAMRCYVASKLGNEVDVPDELMEYEDPTDYVRMGWVDSRGRP